LNCVNCDSNTLLAFIDILPKNFAPLKFFLIMSIVQQQPLFVNSLFDITHLKYIAVCGNYHWTHSNLLKMFTYHVQSMLSNSRNK